MEARLRQDACSECACSCCPFLCTVVHNLGRLCSPRQGSNMLKLILSAQPAKSGSVDEHPLRIERRMRKFHADIWKVEYVS